MTSLACNDADKLQLVITVHTAIDNRETRDAIRQSWGSKANLRKYNASLYFLIGQPKTPSEATAQSIKSEQDMYGGDLLQFDFIDTYMNLTLKTVASLYWLQNNCPNVKYVIKQDDDAFVKLDKLMEHLRQFENLGYNSYIAGQYFEKFLVQRNPRMPFYTPTSLYNGTYYPPLVLGPAYVFTSNVVRPLLKQLKMYKKPWLPWEDIFVTGMLRKLSNIPVYNIRHLMHKECPLVTKPRDDKRISFHRVYKVFQKSP